MTAERMSHHKGNGRRTDAEKFSDSINNIDPAVVSKYQAPRTTARTFTKEQKFFERAVAAAYLAHTRGHRVDADAIVQQDPGLDMTKVSSLLNTVRFRESLEDRGITADDVDAQLSGEQLFAIQVMVDPTTNLSPWAKLKRLGIPFVKWEGWLKQPAFARAYRDISEKIMSESVPNALTRLNQLADAGDLKAIEMLLKLTGRITPEQQSTTDFKRLLAVVLEAVQTHVSDDAEYAAITGDLMKATGQAGLHLGELEAKKAD